MALSVRSVGCTSYSIAFFGFLFISLASAFATMQGSRYAHAHTSTKKNSYYSSSTNGLKLRDYWLFGYPVLIGIWSKMVGGFGARTSKSKHSRKMSQVSVLFICSLILLAFESYVSYDLITYYLPAALIANKSPCITEFWWGNCQANLAIIICLLILAAFKILLSLWSVICCFGSFCCRNQVEQEPDSDSDSESGQQQIARQPTAAQGAMMPGTMMVPMMYSSGQPVVPCRPVPTMQGNMQPMQSNAMPMMQMPYGSYPPVTAVPVLYNAAGQQ